MVSSSTGFISMGRRPDSAWASSSRSPTRRVSRSTSPSTFVSDSSSTWPMRRIRLTSPLITVSGVRSSWLTSAMKAALAGKQPFQPAEGFIECGDQLGNFFALAARQRNAPRKIIGAGDARGDLGGGGQRGQRLPGDQPTGQRRPAPWK